MGILEHQPWWRRSIEKRDVEVEERFLDSSSDGRDSFDEAVEKLAAAPQRRRCLNYMIALTVLNVLILLATSMIATGFPWRILEINYCARVTSSHSPVFRSQVVEFETTHFNGTLFPSDSPSWSRREPGDPEAEAIWEDFEIMHTFPITRDDLIALGKDPETSVRYTEDFGLGDEAYVASLDVQHKIHCLNELRQMAFADYGDDAPTKKVHGQLWWIHLRHCVDMLTQDLICHADADVITYRWVDTQPNAFPDFSLNRQCRSLDDLMSYRDANRVDMDQFVAMEKPKTGITQVPMDRGFYAMYGFKDSDLYPNGKGFGPLGKSDWFGVPPSDGIPSSDRPHPHV